MKTHVKYGVFILTVLCIQYCTGLMCYFCQDTSSDEGKNRCQTWVRTMKHYRRKYNKDGSFLTEKYVKNCTNYANLPEDQIYCMVTRIESRGDIRSFIRDCSDGKNFFDEEWNDRFTNRVLGDNQTTCIYTGTSDLACVTLCQGEHFCNGPLNGAGRIDVMTSLNVTLVILVILMLKKYVL